MGKPHPKSPGRIVSLFFLSLFLFFCFYRIQKQDLVNVEFLTSDAVRRSWSELLFNRLQMGHPPLYFFLTKLWVTIFDHNLISLYAFSFVIGAIGIPLIYLLARELGLGRWSGVTALIWCTHPSILYYARYLRPQMGVIMLCTLYLLILLQDRGLHKWLLLPLGLMGALWSHLFIFFWLGIFGASLLIEKIRNKASREHWFFVVSALTTQILATCLVKGFSGTIEETLGWIKPVTLPRSFEVFIQALGDIEAKIHHPSFFWIIPIFSLLSFIIVFIFNNRKGNRSTVSRHINTRDKWNLLLTSSLIVIGILLGVSIIAQPIWVPRYLVILLPVIILTTVKALSFIPWRYTATACGILIILGMITNSWQMIDQRGFGLRDMIAQFENRYDKERDVLLVLSTTGEEALQLYSTKTFNHFVIERDIPPDTALLSFNEKTQDRQRLWVLEYPRKISIMYTKMWKRLFKPNKFYEYRIHKTALLGYNLPKEIAAS
ncbi:MAG: glycosyltransferase family 39 protein [Waddliaceae bacterium]